MRSWKIVRHLLAPPTSVSLRSSAAAQLQAQAQTHTAETPDVLKSPGRKGRKGGITRSRSMMDMEEVTQGVAPGVVVVPAEAQQQSVAPPTSAASPASPASPTSPSPASIASQASPRPAKVRTQNSQDFDPEYLALPDLDELGSEVSAPTLAPSASPGPLPAAAGETDALPRDAAPPAAPPGSQDAPPVAQEEVAAPPEQEQVAALFFWKPDEEFQPPRTSGCASVHHRGQSPPPQLRYVL